MNLKLAKLTIESLKLTIEILEKGVKYIHLSIIFINFNISLISCSSVPIVNFEQVNAGWEVPRGLMIFQSLKKREILGKGKTFFVLKIFKFLY